jgi:NADH-quinone oxidoreductase subunit J
MVVFLFVVMLLNLGEASAIADTRGKWGRLAAGLLGLALLAQVMALTGKRLPEPFTPGGGYDPVAVRDQGAVGSVAQPLFNEYLLAFELTSILLLVAIVGAVVIGRRRQADAR